MRVTFTILKTALFLIAFSLVAERSFGQTELQKITLSGSIIDSMTQKGVEYATVAIVDSVGLPVSAIAADGNGKFTLELKQKGEFNIHVSSVGFNPLNTKLNVDWTKSINELGNIYLTPGVKLKEVVVTALKPLIRTDADKLTYSVESDPAAATSTLVEMMRKVPQLSVDAEDNVLLNGQSNYKVTVNGKNSSMYSRNFKDVIRSMPANSIKEIEVITNPSSKYEAEGVGGVINIITFKKSNTNGYNGRINSGVGSFDSYTGGVYFAMQQNKLNLTLNYYAGDYGGAESTSSNVTTFKNGAFNKSFTTTEPSRQLFNNFSTSVSYDIDSLNLITLELGGYSGNYRMKSSSNTSQFDENGVETLSFIRDIRQKQTFGTLSGSLDYQRLFKKPDQSLTLSYKLDSNPGSRDYNLDMIGTPNYEEESKNKFSSIEHTFQVDFYNPLKNKKHIIEMGVKDIVRLNNSDSKAQRFDPATNKWVDNNDNMNDMDYTQNIFAAYGGYNFKTGKYSAKAGFRMEGTWNDGVAKTKDGNIDINNTMFNVVPYVSFSYQLKPQHTLKASYTQRLQRPGIWYLNPYVNRADTLNIEFGNPNLKSTINHSFSAGYSGQVAKKIFMNLNATADISDNSITRITTARDGVIMNSYDNIGLNRRFGINTYISYNPTPKFRISLNGSIAYVKMANSSMNIENDGITSNANLSGNWTMWKESNLNFGGYYLGRSINLYGSYPDQFFIYFGLSQSFLKKKLNVSVNLSNPFSYYKTRRVESSSADFQTFGEYKYVQRRINLNVGYRFGKMNTQVKKARRGIVNDDKMVGGSESSGGRQ